MSVIETDVADIQLSEAGSTSQVNNYRILHLLGEGAFSRVYECENGDKQQYALKILNKSFLKRKREYKRVDGKLVLSNAFQKVQKEVAIMKKLSHPHLVKLHEVIDSPADDKMFLVLDLIRGGQVMHWDDKNFQYHTTQTPTGVLSRSTVRACLRDVVTALDYLHRNRICHRDIKPENILLSSNEEGYKLADFGVAYMLEPGSEKQDQMLRSTEGTYHFLAPECTTGEAFDPFQVDTWALGVTMFAMLKGSLPFGTKAASLTDVMTSIREDPLVIPDDIDPVCAALLGQMLEKDPAARITIEQLKDHPWLLDDDTMITGDSEVESDGAIVHVSDQEIEAAFTPVNNFILMTKLKMKMGTRLARARRSLGERDQVFGSGVQPSVTFPHGRRASDCGISAVEMTRLPEDFDHEYLEVPTILMMTVTAAESVVTTPESGNRKVCEISPTEVASGQGDGELSNRTAIITKTITESMEALESSMSLTRSSNLSDTSSVSVTSLITSSETVAEIIPTPAIVVQVAASTGNGDQLDEDAPIIDRTDHNEAGVGEELTTLTERELETEEDTTPTVDGHQQMPAAGLSNRSISDIGDNSSSDINADGVADVSTLEMTPTEANTGMQVEPDVPRRLQMTRRRSTANNTGFHRPGSGSSPRGLMRRKSSVPPHDRHKHVEAASVQQDDKCEFGAELDVAHDLPLFKLRLHKVPSEHQNSTDELGAQTNPPTAAIHEQHDDVDVDTASKQPSVPPSSEPHITTMLTSSPVRPDDHGLGIHGHVHGILGTPRYKYRPTMSRGHQLHVEKLPPLDMNSPPMSPRTQSAPTSPVAGMSPAWRRRVSVDSARSQHGSLANDHTSNPGSPRASSTKRHSLIDQVPLLTLELPTVATGNPSSLAESSLLSTDADSHTAAGVDESALRHSSEAEGSTEHSMTLHNHEDYAEVAASIRDVSRTPRPRSPTLLSALSKSTSFLPRYNAYLAKSERLQPSSDGTERCDTARVSSASSLSPRSKYATQPALAMTKSPMKPVGVVVHSESVAVKDCQSMRRTSDTVIVRMSSLAKALDNCMPPEANEAYYNAKEEEDEDESDDAAVEPQAAEEVTSVPALPDTGTSITMVDDQLPPSISSGGEELPTSAPSTERRRSSVQRPVLEAQDSLKLVQRRQSSVNVLVPMAETDPAHRRHTVGSHVKVEVLQRGARTRSSGVCAVM